MADSCLSTITFGVRP